jgi:hypothetical protein
LYIVGAARNRERMRRAPGRSTRMGLAPATQRLRRLDVPAAILAHSALPVADLTFWRRTVRVSAQMPGYRRGIRLDMEVPLG